MDGLHFNSCIALGSGQLLYHPMWKWITLSSDSFFLWGRCFWANLPE